LKKITGKERKRKAFIASGATHLKRLISDHFVFKISALSLGHRSRKRANRLYFGVLYYIFEH